MLDDRTHVVMSIGGALWVVDTLSGEWFAMSDRFLDVETQLNRQFAAVPGTARFYRVGNDEVTSFELAEADDGTLRTVVTVAPITGETSDSLRIGSGSIMHATDQEIFYTDGLTIWRLALPLFG